MPKAIVLILSLSLGAGAALAQESEQADDAQGTESAQEAEAVAEVAEPQTQAPGGPKTLAGMSILGNEEAPKSLVIVPWKSSEIGDGLGVTDAIDERARPVDKEVFLREVHYYELRSGEARSGTGG